MAQQTWPQQKATQGNGQSALCCCEWDAAAGPRDHSHLTIENTRRVISSPQNKTIKIRFFFNKISRH